MRRKQSLRLKSTITKRFTRGFNSRLKLAGERRGWSWCATRGAHVKSTESSTDQWAETRALWGPILVGPTRALRWFQWEENRGKWIVEKIVKILPNVMKDMNLQIQEVQWILRIKSKRLKPRHFNNQIVDRILKIVQEKWLLYTSHLHINR